MDEKLSKGTRINKFLSEAGVMSRRAADREIEAGKVMIGTRVATAGDRVLPSDTVTYCGKEIRPVRQDILIAFHKPVGIVCTAEKREKNNIVDYINYPERIYPVGRLDKDSEGLILLTNQGELVNRIMRAGNYHEKEYRVTVDREITDAFLQRMAGGIYLEELNVTTRPCKVVKKGSKTFHIILTQGYNRQIRRMCRACGYHVRRLIRLRIMNIKLGNLKPGEYRDVTEAERTELARLIRHSYSAPKGHTTNRNGVSADE